MEKWYVATKKADFDGIAEQFHISPVIARIIRNRDLVEENEIQRFLHGTLKDCYSPWLLKDMNKAVHYILKAIDEKIAIRVIGDYDVDGICSSYILTKGLQVLGGKVDTAIPHRILDGYGLNENLIEEAKRDGIGMIITCDNGIAAASQIALANEYGIQVIVTDHHEVPYEEVFVDKTETEIVEKTKTETVEKTETETVEKTKTETVEKTETETVGSFADTSADVSVKSEVIRKEILPPALAVIDPKQEQCSYPFSGICGGVVAYKVIMALAMQTAHENLKKCLEELLEFAAFATVCDVMELQDENRIIVKEGLKRIRNSGNIGLKALMEVNHITPDKLNAYHLGFVLGPCLNATGRLDTAKRALEMLQSQSKVDAMKTAAELKELNDSRKNMTLKGVEQAIEYIEEKEIQQDKVMIVYLPNVHESLAGIIAGRIREKYNHPVFVLTKGEEGVKGSGRSIEGFHMYEAMSGVKECFTKFGGHAMAAGLSMKEEEIENFREKINSGCRLTPEDFVTKVHIDVPMPLEYASEELADQLELLEPFGVGNPKPLFAQKDVTFVSGLKMGANQTSAKFNVLTPNGAKKQLICFNNLEKFEAFIEEKFGFGSTERLYAGMGNFRVSVVYQMGKNTFRGKTQVQYIMMHYC